MRRTSACQAPSLPLFRSARRNDDGAAPVTMTRHDDARRSRRRPSRARGAAARAARPRRGRPSRVVHRLRRRRPGRVPGARRDDRRAHPRRAHGARARPAGHRARAAAPTCSSATPACRGLTVLARNEGTTLHGNVLRAEAGVELPALVADLAGQGLDGLTFAANIPGSVGGAVVGNAGAYGESVSDLPARRPSARGGQGARRRAGPPGLRLPELAAQVAARHRRPLRLVPAPPRPPPRAAASASPTTRRCARASTRSSTPAAAATSRTRRASCRRPASSRTPASRACGSDART